ncbi:T-complex protein 1 subunit eta [Monoraphidium neglectum]|uniref:T-complex protein 1 subunit eta n=1 Tax=Monoraphidium neglectum TaxID=145388 RepID=A0A0D2JYL5_9CHLO|nr:T-complex protein 1 subunit eta [Monoraphidium neglectum]KIZ03633.1 T-complex protein 1 subunit eta [Monoraphidium neglectum]|eukprot:XP_013902652.1 T-complex protein 1 subunit eta [Monoraphidium neglectum]
MAGLSLPGLDATDVHNKLRQEHALQDGNGKNFGADVNNGGVCNTFDSFVWKPALVKINVIQSATEAACLILSVDKTVRNPASKAPDVAAMGAGCGGTCGCGGRRPGARVPHGTMTLGASSLAAHLAAGVAAAEGRACDVTCGR